MIAGVVLAAGASRRFSAGEPKLLASFRGRPLISWALAHAGDAGLDEVIVVTGPVDLSEVLSTQVVVENPRWEDGLATSLQAGIAVARQRGHDAVVVGLGDQPFVPATAWRAVAASTSPIAVASFDGRRSPPVRLARETWHLLPTTGDFGAREVMRDRPDLVTAIACDGSGVDIDTVEDLTNWG